MPAGPRAPAPLPLDLAYLRQVLLELLEIASPSGRTDHVMQYVGERLSALDIPFTVTRRGALSAYLEGMRTTGADRAVVVHTDTIGGMVKQLKENGRLELKPIGTHSARFAEGAHVRIFTDDLERVITGQVLPLKASGHRYNDDVDVQGVGWQQVEVRVDERVEGVADLRALGIDVGDFVAMLPNPSITPSGYVKSRHLDDKAGVAAVLTAFKAVVDARVKPPVTAHLLVTGTEEIGHGASHGLDPDVAEIVSVDAAVVAPGQQSREDLATVAFGDGVGPFDYHLTRQLAHLGAEHGVALVRDVFDYYRSDVAAAVEAGAHARVALLGFGVDATHGHERTHLDGLRHLAQLVCLYLQSDLVFPEWDVEPAGDLADFPSLGGAAGIRGGPARGADRHRLSAYARRRVTGRPDGVSAVEKVVRCAMSTASGRRSNTTRVPWSSRSRYAAPRWRGRVPVGRCSRRAVGAARCAGSRRAGRRSRRRTAPAGGARLCP